MGPGNASLFIFHFPHLFSVMLNFFPNKLYYLKKGNAKEVVMCTKFSLQCHCNSKTGEQHKCPTGKMIKQ
jgi:hypothetical protein